MNYTEVTAFIQNHFTDGLVLVVGSGLSAAEGIPGMGALADHLRQASHNLTGEDADLWQKIDADLTNDVGLEAALLQHQPNDSLEAWIVQQTCECLMPKERKAIADAISGNRVLRLHQLLDKMLKPPAGLPILTTNYDRLVEVACELAGFHVDTTAIGHYAGTFDHTRSCMGSSRGVKKRGSSPCIDHFPRAVVLKPHGSFDWYSSPSGPRRCSYDLPGPRMIITPGLNKYKQGYNAPFDKHRDLANDQINKSSRLLIIGYGFNDDHLQVHLERRLKEGVPALILNRSVTPKVIGLVNASPNSVCLSQHSSKSGISIHTQDQLDEDPAAPGIWDLRELVKEIL